MSADKLQKEQISLVDTLVAEARDRLSHERADAAESFLRSFYAAVPPQDLRSETVENLFGAAMACWRFAAMRTAGTPIVRVYNPNYDDTGWSTPHTIVEIINDDMPFLVNSIRAELNRRDLSVHLVIHPILHVSRSEEGLLETIHGGHVPEDGQTLKDGERFESWIQVRISEQPGENHLEDIRNSLLAVLADVKAATEDWRDIRGKVADILSHLNDCPVEVEKEDIDETRALLQWVDDDHFTFLGYREYTFIGEDGHHSLKIEEDQGLGILRDSQVSVFNGLRNFEKLPAEVKDFICRSDLLMINKANRISTVHRRVPLDTLFVKRFDEKGNVAGGYLIVGLFTSIAYNRSPHFIPVLRKHLDYVLARSGFRSNSHDGRALLNILETYPRDELFQIKPDELYSIAMGILHLQERQRIALFLRRDPFERFITCLVYVPRDSYSTELRYRFQALLEEAFNGSVSAFYTHLGDEMLARQHVIVETTPGQIPDVNPEELEDRLVEAGRSWIDQLKSLLIQEKGESVGLGLLRRYGRAFPTSYRERFAPRDAVRDMTQLDIVHSSHDLAIHLYTAIEDEPDEVSLKIVNRDHPIALSDILPILEHMGLRVIGENSYEVHPTDDHHCYFIHDFHTNLNGNHRIDLADVRRCAEEAVRRVWHRDMDDDGFNALVLLAKLNWREVVLLRAYAKYLRQAAFTFSQDYIEDTLTRYPAVARSLVALFQAQFDPDAYDNDNEGKAARLAETASLRHDIETALEDVGSLDDDRILRRFLNLIDATLRVNFYQTKEDGTAKGYLSFKFDSNKIEDLPKPKPFREIFVYSPLMEGVHLRFGKVARGGLRWSDRREDFRTEILGLVKAQQVKNAVIVPVGSKGGFVLKRPPAASEGREAMMKEGIARYRDFISGMLDITDNLDGTDILPPAQVLRRDEDDPYLVVAADKGTATFSDIANNVAEDYGFWLGDAFASGGSAGYDHKKMGITARGAWESVKRHFREIGHDTQSQDFSVVGVGDMSGDVFGNGMLLSRHIRLIAAFNHLHIFIDPSPDAATSYEERQRLFQRPRSSWTDYDPNLISQGGGVFDRKAKSIRISPEIRTALGLSQFLEQITPSELIKAIVRAEVDLLWFGGIGTYIKAEEENHSDVGDRANDPIRINGQDVRAKVIGEGANLAATQAGRIEYALSGGRLNTDAVDNSAGVDCSDHEVNIKILLRNVEKAGDMTRKQRDILLEDMTEEVAELVLRDNYRQTLAITMMEQQGYLSLDHQARMIRKLERSGRLDRALEYLPDEEQISDRRATRKGLTRPELAVLLAYAKLDLYDALLDSDLPDDPLLIADLQRYFPQPLQDRFPDAIEQHRLRREIIATYVNNSMVNRVGATFVSDMQDRTGVGQADVARAYAVVRDAFGFRDLWAEIDALDLKVPADVQHDMLREGLRLMDRSVVWFLRNCQHPLDVTAVLEEFGAPIAELRTCLNDLITPENRAIVEERATRFIQRGAPEALANSVARLTQFSPAMDIVRIARQNDLLVRDVGRVYLGLGATFRFDWLRKAAGAISGEGQWTEMATQAIVEDLVASQTELTIQVLTHAKTCCADTEDCLSEGLGDNVVKDWIAAHKLKVAHARELLEEISHTANVDLAMLAVANRELRNMILA